jgi:hypothetical protein
MVAGEDRAGVMGAERMEEKDRAGKVLGSVQAGSSSASSTGLNISKLTRLSPMIELLGCRVGWETISFQKRVLY